MRFFRFSSIIALLITVVLTSALSGPSPASDRPDIRVLLLPFEMHSATDITGERRELMEAIASSLYTSGAEIAGLESVKERMLAAGSASLGESDAYELAGKVSADFAVVGSVTRLGTSLNADWRLIDLKSKSTVAFYYESSSSAAELLAKAGKTAVAMFARMGAALKSRPAVKAGVIDRIVITGNRRVDTAAIATKLTSKAGEPYSPDDVKQDIRNIYGTGYFEDVAADLSDTASGKVLTIIVSEMPFIRAIELKGNDELKDESINAVLTIKTNTVLDRSILEENANKIKELYKQDGFYLAEVRPVIESDGLEATIVFDIDEKEPVRVKRITIIGSSFFSEKKLKGFMNTKEAGPLSFLTKSDKFDELLFENDLAIIMGRYFDNGFINVEILDHRVLLSADKKWFYITIALSEGEQYTVGGIDIKGDMLPSTSREELLEKLKLEQGEIFNRTTLSKDMQMISDVYGDEGYAFAEVNPLTRVDTALRTVDITLDIKKNDLVYIDRIDITGNVRTRDKVIRRELEVEEGKLFSSSELKRSQNNLKRLGYFEDVRISQLQAMAKDRLNLNVDVAERPTGSISIGMGYSSVDKLIGTASIAQSNFMGTGIKLDLSGTVSASSSTYMLSFTEPWLFDKPISAGFDLYNTGKEYPDFELRKNGGAIRFGFPIIKRYTRMYLTYKLEDIKVFNVATSASTFIKEQEGTTTESSIKALIRHDTRNDAFFPTDGSVVSLSTEYAGGLLGGNSYFIKYEADMVKFFPLPFDTTISLRGTVGYLQGYDGHTPPIYERFYLGGINSIRGFQTRSVGPKDPDTGELIGGNSMVTFNTEFVFPLMSQQNIRGVLFFDTGNAYKGRINFGDMKLGAGAGIRWFSPVGPLRLELGFNLDRKEGEKAQQWEFAIGTLF